MSRTATRRRVTKETSIELSIDLDGTGDASASTGLPFYDHMLEQVGKHGGFDLRITATGDLHIDSHHTVEDVAIALGEAMREALESRPAGPRPTLETISALLGGFSSASDGTGDDAGSPRRERRGRRG
jgi:imidazoleglycerol phosphate dehydratase HisB